MLVLKGLVGLHRTVQLQLLQCYWLDIDLDYCDSEWFYEDLQDLLELTPQKDVLFIIGAAAAAKSLSRVRLCATPETAAHQAPLSLGFSRQEHWSGLPFPSLMH